MKKDILELLKELPLLRGADEKALSILLDSQDVSVEAFDENRVVYSQRSDTDSIGIVISGSARVFSGGDGESALLRTLNKGDVFGIANLYCDSESFPTKIVTSRKSEILFISKSHFRELIESDRTLLRNYLEFQSQKIMYLNKKITVFTAGSAEKKLACFMLDHISNDTFTPPTSMKRLSDMLGIGRASLYRAIDSLTECGAITEKTKDCMTVNIEKLKNI